MKPASQADLEEPTRGAAAWAAGAALLPITGTRGRTAGRQHFPVSLPALIIRSDLAGGGVQTAKHTEKTKSGRARASNMVTMVHRLRRRSGR